MTVSLERKPALHPEALLLLAKEFMKLPTPQQKRKWKGLLSAIRRTAGAVSAAVKSKRDSLKLAAVCRKLRALLNLLDRRLERDITI